MRPNILEKLGHHWLLFDGGMGSLLQKRGLRAGELPELWNLTHREDIISVHQAYLEAGSDVVYTNTFGANGLKYTDKLAEVVNAAVANAAEARRRAGREEDAYVALDIGPCGKLLEPMGDLPFEEAVSLFRDVVVAGTEAGADLIVIETMNDSMEVKAAVLAAKENSDLPVAVTCSFDENGKMLTGGTPESVTAMLEGLRVDAVGANCSLGPDLMINIARRFASCSSLPVIIKPNAGIPRVENGETVYDVGPLAFAETMAEVEHFGMEPGDTIGTGPYLVTEWLSNDHYTLEYNPLYWGEEPSVKKLVVRIIPDANTQNLMFQNGELDLIDLKSLDNSIVEATYKRLYLNQIVSTPEVGLTYFIMNENNRFLQDVNVRKAIGMAIDVDTIISTIYNGNALREHGVIPTGIWGHNDDLESFSYNPDAARALLQEAGYRDGDISFEISLDSAADGSLQLVNHFISQQLKAIGINASVKSYDHSSWLSLRLSGEMDSFVAHWGMDYNDPSNIMYAFFGNAQNSASRSINYSNKNIMARVAAAASIVDEDAREAEYQALEKQLICEDAVWVPMYSELHLYCFGSKVQSFTPQWAGFSDFYASDVLLK